MGFGELGGIAMNIEMFTVRRLALFIAIVIKKCKFISHKSCLVVSCISIIIIGINKMEH